MVSIRGSIEALLRDKASMAVMALAMVFWYAEDVETLSRLLRLFGLIVLAGWIVLQGYKHEQVKLEEKGKDLKREFEDWILKMWDMMKDGETHEETDSDGQGGTTEDTTGSIPGDSSEPGPSHPPFG